MSAAHTGAQTVHLPPDFPQARFRYDPRFERACFIVVDDIWRRWTVIHVPGADDHWRRMQAAWPVAFAAGDIAVYANPERVAGPR